MLYEPFDPRIEQIWRDLEVDANPSYFQSWGWIENWLACLPREHIPPLAVVTHDDRPIAAFFLGQRRVLRHGFIPSALLYLNTTGDDDHCVEHNNVLRTPSGVTLDRIIELLPAGWDELVLPAVGRGALSELGSIASRYQVRIDREANAPFVDLELVRSVDGGYPALLSPATRAQIHRSQGAVGPLEVEVARDEIHAIDIYYELTRLHARHDNALRDPVLATLHRRLIETRLRHGEIQLVRVRAGGATIGCLYNFIHGDRVLGHQIAVERFADPHVKPDFLCHVAAIDRGALAGMAVYELPVGDARPRRGLATGETRRLWLRVQRPRFAIATRLQRWRHALATWRRHRTDTALGVPSPARA